MRASSRANAVHDTPAGASKWRGYSAYGLQGCLGKRQPVGEVARWSGEYQAQPDANKGAQRRHAEDQRGVPGTTVFGSDLANIGIHDGKVGTNANTGNHPGDDEGGVVTNEGVKQRT